MIVALGGGSAMDTAKVVAASDGDFARVRNYVENGKGADKLGRTPIIAVPTTAGTGSEVTCWATVWDTANKKKYSLARPELYPEAAILDPELTLGIPARAHRFDRPRCAVACARKPVEHQCQSGFRQSCGLRRAGSAGMPAGACEGSRTISNCARA